MDSAQIEQELNDLEARLERLRALYEQYFLGLEKLEPTVLRKDVDRKLWVLRREQIRNTGLRFKFQMLIQRYNTYQQYWNRITREIENGTYRRDIIKVAKRFGEQDALTILGKKRAEQYKRLAENQLARKRKRTGQTGDDEAVAEQSRAIDLEDAPISLTGEDYELVDDAADSVGTPPARVLPPVHAEGEADMEALLMAATVGVTTWQPRPQDASNPRTSSIVDISDEAEEEAASITALASKPKAPPPRVAPAPKIVASPKAPPAPAFAPEEETATPASPVFVPAPAAKAEEPKAPAATSPAATSKEQPAAAKPQPTAAAKSRVAELAAQMRAKKQQAAKPQHEELELDLFESAIKAPKVPTAVTPTKSSSPRSTKVPAARGSQPRRSTRPPAKSTSSESKRSSRPPPKAASNEARRSSVPPPKSSKSKRMSRPPPAAPAQVVKVRPPPKPAAPAQAAAPKPAAPAPKPAPRNEDLSEQKMREIYASYVGAKRAANESTAGITFDKLSASLQAQVAKIKSAHPTRKVDFEVVTKDGKTALRPIVK